MMRRAKDDDLNPETSPVAMMYRLTLALAKGDLEEAGKAQHVLRRLGYDVRPLPAREAIAKTV